MKRTFQDLESRQFDLLVIGGGIFGACAAWDATLRGLSVALVEKADFGGGTSANSFKIVHGGIRYLQHADLARLRASCRERSAFLRIAPHLVTPLPIVVPTYGRGRQGKAFLGAGMLLYDCLTMDRNAGIADVTRRIPFSRFLDRTDVAGLFPGIQEAELTGGAVFRDGQMYNPPRLVLAFIRSASDEGALAVNYAEAERLERSDDVVVGARVRDRLSGDTAQVRARSVLNAAGPWVPSMMSEREQAPLRSVGSFSRDACFVVPRRFAHPYGLALQGRTHDPDAIIGRAARHLFVVPWRQYTLCGVWHRVWTAPPEDVHVSDEEIRAFIDEVNAALPSLDLRPEDVGMRNAGLVPFGDNEPGADHLRYGKKSHIIDHDTDAGLKNLVSLIGVRYTMARGDASQAVDLLCKKLGASRSPPATDAIPVFGGDFDDFEALVATAMQTAPFAISRAAAEALAHNHGTEYPNVFAASGERPGWTGCVTGSTTLKAEVVYAVREEMAVRLTDIVFRRTDLATGGYPGRPAFEEAATLAAQELAWSVAKRGAELADVERCFINGVKTANSRIESVYA